jgi:hypothetical protein
MGGEGLSPPNTMTVLRAKSRLRVWDSAIDGRLDVADWWTRTTNDQG